VAADIPNPAHSGNTETTAAIPNGSGRGSAAPAHPTAAIPLPAHGFATLDVPVRALASVPAVEVISAAAISLVSAAGATLGLAPGEEPDIDLDEARALITGLAGLLAATGDQLGDRREPLLEGLRTLQKAFREAAAHPDAPGDGPGEHLLS
jgi:uncharacterized protein DUF1844